MAICNECKLRTSVNINTGLCRFCSGDFTTSVPNYKKLMKMKNHIEDSNLLPQIKKQQLNTLKQQIYKQYENDKMFIIRTKYSMNTDNLTFNELMYMILDNLEEEYKGIVGMSLTDEEIIKLIKNKRDLKKFKKLKELRKNLELLRNI